MVFHYNFDFRSPELSSSANMMHLVLPCSVIALVFGGFVYKIAFFLEVVVCFISHSPQAAYLFLSIHSDRCLILFVWEGESIAMHI